MVASQNLLQGGTITITLPALPVILTGLWHAITQVGLNEGVYRTLVKNPAVTSLVVGRVVPDDTSKASSSLIGKSTTVEAPDTKESKIIQTNGAVK